MIRNLTVLLAGALSFAALNHASAAAPASENAQTAMVRSDASALPGRPDFPVYVDRETGFAFIKTPAGWKFVRKIESAKMGQVPREFFVPVDQRDGTLLALTTKR